MTKPLTIGLLARSAEVNIETIRYYQRIGLIQEPNKPKEGYRIYATEIINRIRFIKRAQALGFKLKEIAELLSLTDESCSEVQHQAQEKSQQITQQIKDLRKLKKTLDTLVERCQSNDKKSKGCPIIETLTNQ